MLSPTWAEVNLSAIEQNVRHLSQISQAPLMAVVKANGYGHGAIEISKAALAAGAAWLGVARVDEGLALVQAGIRAPILVLGPVAPSEVDDAILNGLTLTLYNAEVAEIYADRSHAIGRAASIHLKVDTGMGRLGVLAEDVPTLARRIIQRGNIHLDGVFTHLARAGESDFAYTQTQLLRFRNALESLQAAGLHPTWTHAANSAAALTDPAVRLDLVRIGAALYGLDPSADIHVPPQLRPALAWKAQLASCKTLPAKWGVSYSHQYVNYDPELIGVLPIGYADGWRRTRGNVVLIAGRRTPVVGRVCMDMCMVRLPQPVSPGTEVILLGEQDGEAIRAEEVAARWATNNLDVVSSISARVPRIYVRDGASERTNQHDAETWIS